MASALVAILSSCGDKFREDNATGKLSINVTATSPEALTRASVSTADFPVRIAGTGDLASEVREYENPGSIPSSIMLPCGIYTVSAHSAGEIAKEMTVPYYSGSKNFEILTGITTNVELNCRMANSRIRIVFDDDFREKYTSWNITIHDGSSSTLSFDEKSSYADVYWYFDDDTDRITVDFRAVTVEGNTVYASNVFVKADSDEGYTDIENPYFTGGDAITINFTPAIDMNGYVDGIIIKMNVTFDNEDESVTIEVKDQGAADDPDDENDPDDPNAGDAINVTFTYGQSFNVTYQQTSGYPDVEVKFDIKNGLKNLYVKVSGSDDFELACGLMGMTAGDGMDLAGDDAKDLADLFTLPKVGDTSYTFSLNETLWGLLTCSPGYPGSQTFTLKAIDKKGNMKTGNLTININEK